MLCLDHYRDTAIHGTVLVHKDPSHELHVVDLLLPHPAEKVMTSLTLQSY